MINKLWKALPVGETAAAALLVGAGPGLGVAPKPQAGDCLVAVDGGYMHCLALGLEPDMWIGDFDSLPAQGMAAMDAASRSGRLLSLPRAKDDTDMMAAIGWALGRGYRRFLLYGGTGGRLDHSLANIHCLEYLRRSGAAAWMLDGGEAITLLGPGRYALEGEVGDGFSLFAWGGEASGLDIAGAEYGLHKGRLGPEYPLGISNVFARERVELYLEKGRLVLFWQKKTGVWGEEVVCGM